MISIILSLGNRDVKRIRLRKLVRLDVRNIN